MAISWFHTLMFGIWNKTKGIIVPNYNLQLYTYYMKSIVLTQNSNLWLHFLYYIILFLKTHRLMFITYIFNQKIKNIYFCFIKFVCITS